MPTYSMPSMVLVMWAEEVSSTQAFKEQDGEQIT